MSFDLKAGQLLQIAGANGSGKTTLLRCLCGIFVPEAGEVLWNGTPIADARSEFLASLRYVGHKPGIKDDLTPVENLELEKHVSGSNNGVTPDTALERLGVQHVRKTPCRALSMGQRRRVALARLLISRAQLWVLDEPLAALDTEGQELVSDLLQTHAKAGGVAVFSSHQGLELSGPAKVASIVLDHE